MTNAKQICRDGTGGGAHLIQHGSDGQCAGTKDMWSAVLDWRFLPKWDAYIGTFFSLANGGLANGDITRNNLATTAAFASGSSRRAGFNTQDRLNGRVAKSRLKASKVAAATNRRLRYKCRIRFVR